jgi:hypothetical protein
MAHLDAKEGKLSSLSDSFTRRLQRSLESWLDAAKGEVEL